MKPGTLNLLFPILTMILWSGCASVGPPLPPSLKLPAPVTDLRARRQGDHVYLAWTAPQKTTDQENILQLGSTLICRSRLPEMKTCGVPVGQAQPLVVSASQPKSAPATQTYVDQLPAIGDVKPEDEVAYAVEVLNDRNRGDGLSNIVQVPMFRATPPPQDFQAQITAEGVKITWACPGNPPPSLPNVQYHLGIYRRQEGSQADEKIAEPDLMDCRQPVLDQSFQWEKTYDYFASAVTVVARASKPPLAIEGDDTPAVRVLAHDIFPPAVPTGLQAVFSGPGQKPFVDLIWSPDTTADLAGYNLYRHEENGLLEKLNGQPVKTPAYRDTTVQPGRKYFYAVTAVDVRGNESEKSQEASEKVP